ncbi:MAG TPA: Ig-like domain-containing protein, partial [Pyrinomonadaceae bacterium]|nr:Ig-like domain-containing protein [Pyrinomonadaceae bacterium]
MKHSTSAFSRRHVRALIAGLLSYVLLAAPFAVLAQRTSRGATSGTSTGTTQTAVPSTGTLDAPRPNATGPVITATKVDSFSDPDNDGKATPGQVITYDVTITNGGDQPATGVVFNDTPGANTTLVPGSVNTQPIARDDAYNVVGNVRIQVPDGANDLLANDRDPDTGTSTGLTITSAPTTTTQGGNLNINTSDGSFTYNPPVGFTGSDTFTYTVTDGAGKTDTATVTLTVAGMIFFVNASSPAGGDGRLTSPFNCLVGTDTGAQTCFSNSTHDEAGDNIFLFSGSYTGGLTLLNNQRLIGAGATATLASIASVTPETYSDPLPATGGASPTITTTAATTNALNLGQGNLLRGFTVGNTTGAKISGNGFGTLTAGNTTPDLILNGTGQALSLTNGTFAATSAFGGVTTTSSSAQGILLSQVGGTVSFGGTTVSGSIAQGILVQQSSVDINFGNTSVTGGTDGVSLVNNASGTRTFGTLSITTPSNVGFLHAVGGGAVSAGATTITNPAGIGINVLNSNAGLSFGATTVNKNATAGTGVSLSTNTSQTISFASLNITTSNGTGLLASAGGTINVTGGSVAATSGPALDLSGVTLSASFTGGLASTNSATVGINMSNVTGGFAAAGVNISNPTGIGIQVANGAGGGYTFGNTIVSGSGGTGVSLTSNAVAIGFSDLDINPDSGQRAFHATNNTGTLSSTSGDIAATSNVTLEITGASAAARTPLSMTLTNLDSTNSNGIGVNLNFVSGNLTVNDPGTATNISNPTGIGIQVQNSGAGTLNFGNTTVSGSGGTGISLGGSTTGNAGNVSFGTLNISPDAGQRALLAQNNTGALTSTSGAIVTTNATAVEIQGTSNASRTPLNMQLTSVNVTGGNVAPNGVFLNNTSSTGSPGGFRILGNGGSCTIATPTCTGGRIQQTTGGDGATGGTGVRLVNADSVSLALMRLNDHPNFAIYGNNVNGFTLTSAFIHGANGTNAAIGTEEGSISFDNLLGSASISNTDIDGGKRDNLRVVNTTGTLNRLTVSNTIIRFHDNTTGNDAFHFEGFNAGTVMNLTITGSTFRGARGDMIDTIAQPGVTQDIVIRSNSFTNEQSNVVSGNTAIIVQGSGTVTYDVSCNKVQQVNAAGTVGTAQGHGINVAKSTAGGNFSGTVFNNTVGKPGVQSSGAGLAGSGINFISNGVGTHTALIKNNAIRNYGESGIRATGNNGSSTANLTIVGNVTTEPHPTFGFAGLFVDVGAFASDTTTFNVKVGGAGAEQNDFTLGTPIDPGDISLNETAASANTHLNLTRPPSASNVVETVLQDNNVGTPTTNNSGTITLVNTVPALPAAIDESCTPPAAPETFNTDEIAPGGTAEQTSAVPSASQPQQTPVDAESSVEQTANTTDAAIAQTTEQQQPVNGEADGFAQARGASIVRAAYTEENPEAVLGLSHNDRKDSAQGFKHSARSTPLRRSALSLPAKRNAAILQAGTVSVNIGTLNPGESVTITFQVTVADPFPSGVTQVSNQGTVSGTNFANVLTDDPTPPGANDPTVTPIQPPADISVRDAKAAELPSGTNVMSFTVALSVPAPNAITVNYATADDTGGTNPAVGGADCTTAGVDYKTTSGTLSFAAGQQVQTVSVEVCSDSETETDETLLVNLSNPTNANLGDAQAVGTITTANPAGTILITELRTSGPSGAGDDFVEVYNNTDSPVTVSTTDGSSGWALVKMGAACGDTPIIIGVIPNGTVIPARGHYLFVGSAYSLANYGGTGAAAGDQTMSADIEDDRNVGLFNTSNIINIGSTTRLDAVGFGNNTGNNCDLLREGTMLPAVTGSNLQYSFFRDECGKGGQSGVFGPCPTGGKPVDNNVNSTDFIFADTLGTSMGFGQRLGAPGPQRSSSPIVRNGQIAAGAFDPDKTFSQSPNRERDLTSDPANNATFGTMTIRRTYTNNTGGNVTRLRFRIIDLSVFPVSGGVADLRPRTSTDTVVTITSGASRTVRGT